MLMDFKQLVQTRRSHRRFTAEGVSPDDLQLILRAALMSPTSKGQRQWRFVVVDDPLAIEKIADAKETGSAFLKGAPLAIVVCGKPADNDGVRGVIKELQYTRRHNGERVQYDIFEKRTGGHVRFFAYRCQFASSRARLRARQ